jgi:predicted transcriptional regulator
VLQKLWAFGEPSTSRALRESFPVEERPALTTLLTVLDRLEKKGLVTRVPSSGGSLFSATREESEATATAMGRILGQTHDREAALLHFAGQLDPDDIAALRKALNR